jgi:hypothetical protein
MVVIAEGTRGLLGNLFEFEDLGAKDLKGVAGPCEPGRRCHRVRRKAASRHCTRRVTALVGRVKNSNCCFGAGRGQKPVRARWCCSVSESRGSRPRCWNDSLPNRTRGCANSAPRSTPTARVIRSSAKWSRRRMRSQNVVSTQELLVGGSGGDLNRFAAQASTNATGKAGAGDSCAALTHGTHKRILSNTSTAPRLRRVCPPKS